MKTSPLAAVPAALITLCTITPSNLLAQNANASPHHTFPAMPSGWLTAFPTIVQTGTRPTLTWGINYPSVVRDYVTITPPSTVTAKEELDVEIRVLGNGVTAHNTSTGAFTGWVPAEAQISFDGSSFTPIFYGTNLNVNPNTVVWSKTRMRKNETLRFGGRYFWNNKWGPTYTTSNSSTNVRTLVNAETPPSTGHQPMHQAPTLEDFIRPYLDGAGNVQIGPMDVIVFMELTHTPSQQSDPGYDLQDMVLLVTFKSRAKTNNGHGNNIDGIDSSNPGNAPFINLDTDPTIDDEGHGGGAYPSNP